MAGLTHSWPPPQRHAALLQGRREKCSAQSRSLFSRMPGSSGGAAGPWTSAPSSSVFIIPHTFPTRDLPLLLIKTTATFLPHNRLHLSRRSHFGIPRLSVDSFSFSIPSAAPPSPTKTPTACSAGREPGGTAQDGTWYCAAAAEAN